MAQHHKRRLIPIVDRRFQFKYTSLIVVIAAIVSSVLGWLLLRSYQELNQVIQISAEIGEKLNADDALFIYKLSLGFLVGEVFVLGLMGLLVTHRVVGPIFVLHRHLNILVDGGYPQMRPLRAGDEFKDAFDAFAEFVDGLKKRDQEEHDKLKALVDAARSKGMAEAEIKSLQDLVDERAQRLAGPRPA